MKEVKALRSVVLLDVVRLRSLSLPTAEHQSNLYLLQDAKQQRENLGVEMYGFQQHLTRVQKELQKAQQSTAKLSMIRHSTEEHVLCLHKQVEEESSLLDKERDKVRTTLLHHPFGCQDIRET